MGLTHVRRGCLARKIQDIRSDGSRIEGSHKGWSGIHRSFALGLELAEAFGHDHVLRRNIRVEHNSKKPSPFVISTYGSHHTRLVNSNNARWNTQVKKDKRDAGQNPLRFWPTLPVVNSGERFGLVKPEDMILSNEALKTIKEEDEIEEEEASSNSLLLHNDNDAAELMRSLQIDPGLLSQPQVTCASSSHVSAAASVSSQPIDSTTLAAAVRPPRTLVSPTSQARSPSVEIIEQAASTKRKASDTEEFEGVTDVQTELKRPRVGSSVRESPLVSDPLASGDLLIAHSPLI